MNKIIDKTAILIICVILSAICGVSVNIIVLSLLISIIESSFFQCTDNDKNAIAIQLGYMLLCLVNWKFCFTFSINLYDIMQRKNKYLKIIFIIPVIYCLYQCNVREMGTIFSCLLISIILSLRSFDLKQAQEKLILQRDSSEENKILLRERNKYLMDKHDYEINLAILTERSRIAREIHDNVGHMLSRVILQMGAVKIINTDENIKPQLEDINNSINTAMTSIRESVHNLHDESVQLENAIKEIIKSLENNYSVKLDISVSEATPKEIKFFFISIVKESVSNIIKHSNGNRVTILIREHPGFYQVVINDNGINNNKIHEGGMGLENMKYRTEKLNGIFKYYIEKDGFKVFVSIPKKENYEYNNS